MSVVWKWSNATSKMSKETKFWFYRDELICWAFWFQTLFYWKGGIFFFKKKKYDFQLKIVRKGWQNIQF